MRQNVAEKVWSSTAEDEEEQQSYHRSLDIPHTIEFPSHGAEHSPSLCSGPEDLLDYDPMTLSSYGTIDMPRRKLFPSSASAASLSSKHSALTRERQRERRLFVSKCVIYLSVLVSDTCRGILFPTLWLLVYSLGGTKAAQGVVVAAFSGGRILSSPFFGAMTEVHGYRHAMVVCNAVIVLGAFLYVVANRVEMVVLAQFVIGIGAGSLGAGRAYIAEQATFKTRTQELALLTSLQYAGFTVTPIVGAMISALSSGAARFTMPALFIAAAAALCIVLLSTVFDDVERGISHEERLDISEPVRHEEYTEAERDETKELLEVVPSSPPLAWETTERTQYSVWTLSVAGCALNFVTKGTIAVFETLTAMYVMKYLQWDAVRLGVTLSLCGLVGVALLLCFPLLLRYVEDTDLVLGGVALMILACLSLIQFSPQHVVSEHAVYASLVLMFAVGYPVGHTALIGMFSKICKSGPQGKMLGVFGSVGSLARIVFPLCSGAVVQVWGFDVAFAVAACLLFISLLFMAYFRSVMVGISQE